MDGEDDLEASHEFGAGRPVSAKNKLRMSVLQRDFSKLELQWAEVQAKKKPAALPADDGSAHIAAVIEPKAAPANRRVKQQHESLARGAATPPPTHAARQAGRGVKSAFSGADSPDIDSVALKKLRKARLSSSEAEYAAVSAKHAQQQQQQGKQGGVKPAGKNRPVSARNAQKRDGEAGRQLQHSVTNPADRTPEPGALPSLPARLGCASTALGTIWCTCTACSWGAAFLIRRAALCEPHSVHTDCMHDDKHATTKPHMPRGSPWA
jgi:hypothetical protein